MDKHKFITLMESELVKQEIVMAARTEFVKKIQDYAQKVANMKTDHLLPLVQQIKAEYGVSVAQEFNESIGVELDSLLQSMTSAQDLINTEVLKLTGDVESGTAMEDELGAMETGFEAGVDMESELGGEVPEMDFGEPIPVEREEKFESRKFGVMVESVKGSTGKKFFESKADAMSWFDNNKDKIAKIKFIK